jgi:hypothetical protein
VDKEDSFQRDMERRKRRAERRGTTGAGDGAFIHEAEDWNLETEAKVRHPLLKRNPHHGVFQVSHSSPRVRRAKRDGKKRSRSPDII